MERLDMAQKRADGVLSYPEDLFLHIAHFDDLMRQYQEAAKAITTKLEDFQVDLISHNGRSCIETITFRSKTPSSIEAMRTQLDDIAGIRVICPFWDDFYMAAYALAREDDIQVLAIKDHIACPKPNGYRSYHMIVQVHVPSCGKREPIRVEIQLRTVAMDLWANLERRINRHSDAPQGAGMVDALRTCANTIADTDQWMLQLQEYVGRHQWTVLFSGHIPQVCEAHLPASLLTTAFHTCTNAKAGPLRRSDPHRSDLYGTVTDAVIQIRSTGLQSANKDCKPVWTLEGSFQDIICLGDTTSKARPAFGSFQKVSRMAYHTTPPWVETDTPSLQNPNFS